VYLVGVVIMVATFRRPLLAVFWPAAAVFLLCAVLIVGIDIAAPTRD
jgi:hypothetical protein